MILKKVNGSARRRGTTIAAAALSVAMVGPFVHAVAAPAPFAAVAQAQEAGAAQGATEAADPYGAIYSPGIYEGKQTVSGSVLFYDQYPGTSNGNTASNGGEAAGYGKALPAANLTAGENFKGATVYAQWFEKPNKSATGGEPSVASPVYKTTVNEDGTFSINMRPFMDSQGNLREFWAQYAITAGLRGQKVKIWVDGYDRDQYEMVRGYGERIMPDGTVTDSTGGAGWSSSKGTVAGAHQVFVRRADAKAMLGDESGWRKVTDEELAMKSSNGGAVYGQAYWNMNQGLGKLAQKEIAGPSGDRKVKGVKVVGAYLSDKAVVEIEKYVEQNKGSEFQDHSLRGAGWDVQDELKLQAWINQQIKSNPDWIAEKVVTETNGNGEYRLQFNGTYGIRPGNGGKVPADKVGTVAPTSSEGYFSDNRLGLRGDQKHVNWDWMFIDTPDLPTGTSNMGAWRGNVWQGLTAGSWGVSNIGTGVAADQFDMRGMQAALLTPNYNVQQWDMALFPNKINFGVEKYDSLTNFARPGDKTHAFTKSLPAADMNARYEVEWRDGDGNVIKTCKGVDPAGNLLPSGEGEGIPAKSDGSLPNCDIQVPENLEKTTVYTATLYGLDESGARIPLASDSFTAVTGTASVVTPKYDETPAEVGKETTTKPPKFVDQETGEPIASDDERLKGAKYEILEESLPEGWKASINEKTGEITVTPGENGSDGKKLEPGQIEDILVRVTYADGTSNGAKAPIKVGEDAKKPTEVDDSGVKPVKPTDEKQDTGIKVTNPDKDTKVSATDEDGNKVPAEIDENGNVVVTPGKNVDCPINVVVEDPDLEGGKTTTEVPVEGHEKDRDDNNSSVPGKDLSSNLSPRCINTGLAVGIPLLFLIPVGLASQMNIPGLSGFVDPINKQIQDLNTQLQKQAGIFQGPLADKVAGIDAQLKRFVADHQQAAGAVALIAAGALAIGLIADACAPGAGGGSSTGSSK
ncbi:YPDG domain-containing protein [Corynebacterium striatum]|uniref:YPDG domain-containing protein n=1 Tax=Corynebacterium striatum TaxID=43770 RepID=UPI00255166F2|nr:YPDG domain-containing protein [Corynebacterium striatum]MDK8826776.1 YPDG domain-containing protein [Corynebacterium striatum]